jgi:hypothetical protein
MVEHLDVVEHILPEQASPSQFHVGLQRAEILASEFASTASAEKQELLRTLPLRVVIAPEKVSFNIDRTAVARLIFFNDHDIQTEDTQQRRRDSIEVGAGSEDILTSFIIERAAEFSRRGVGT